MPSPSLIADRRLRFAIVGCGRISQSHFDAIALHARDAELVSVCDTSLPMSADLSEAQQDAAVDALRAAVNPRC